MIIEIIGLHGAGKTTLKKAIREQSNNKIIDESCVFLLPYVNTFLMPTLQRLCLISWQLKPIRDKVLAMKKTNRSKQTSYYQNGQVGNLSKKLTESQNKFEIASKKNLYTIFDEGSTKLIATIYKNDQLSKTELNQLYEDIIPPDIVISLNIENTELRFDRLFNRVKGDYETKWRKAKELIDSEEEMLESLHISKDIYKSKGIKIIELDAQNDIDSQINELKQTGLIPPLNNS